MTSIKEQVTGIKEQMTRSKKQNSRSDLIGSFNKTALH
jgi:hypothetical protein